MSERYRRLRSPIGVHEKKRTRSGRVTVEEDPGPRGSSLLPPSDSECARGPPSLDGTTGGAGRPSSVPTTSSSHRTSRRTSTTRAVDVPFSRPQSHPRGSRLHPLHPGYDLWAGTPRGHRVSGGVPVRPSFRTSLPCPLRTQGRVPVWSRSSYLRPEPDVDLSGSRLGPSGTGSGRMGSVPEESPGDVRGVVGLTRSTPSTGRASVVRLPADRRRPPR